MPRTRCTESRWRMWRNRPAYAIAGHNVPVTGFPRLAVLEGEGVGFRIQQSKIDSSLHFRDVTIAAGLDPSNHGHWGSSAGFMDLEGNGRLDLVLLNSVVFGRNQPHFC